MKKNGFTLIELLVVIAILVVVAIIGATVYSGISHRSRDSKRRTDIDETAKVYEIIYAKTGNYGAISGSDFTSNVIPQDPTRGDYFNLRAVDGKGFKVCASLESNPNNYCNQTSTNCYCKISAQSVVSDTNSSNFIGTGLEIGYDPPPPAPSSGNLVIHVNSSTDDANEDGGNFDTTSDVWVGNGMDPANSYAAYRFTALNIPQGATIQSAKLEITSSQGGWITVGFDMAAENIGNSPTFSSSNRPSQRTLTTASVNHFSNSQWVLDSVYELEEIKSVIQEVIDRPDWVPNNSISVILKGNLGSWARKFTHSFDTSPIKSVRLKIIY